MSNYKDKIVYRRKHKTILKYLEKKYDYVIKSFDPQEPSSIPQKNIVWTMWWQDEQPDMVKMCLHSISANFKDYTITFITKRNYTDYIELPDYVLSKVDSGDISITHLSDIIRWKLLRKYGGFWLDATTLIKNTISGKALIKNDKLRYWTTRLPEKEYVCISRYRWNCAEMYMHQNYLLARFIDTFLTEYLKHEPRFIDYFLTDFLTDIVYRKFKVYRDDLKKIEFVNQNFYFIDGFLNELYSESAYQSLVGDMFKLNRRWNVQPSKEMKLTMFGYLLQKFSKS